MGFHVDLEELHKAANKLNQEASRIETQLTDAKNSVNKIITSEALQGKTGQAIYQQLNNVDAAVLVGLADTSKVLASEFSSLLSSFHSSIGETSNSAILDEDYLNQLKDNLNNFKNQHGAQEENISSIYASISDLISLSRPQSNYDADSDTASQLLSTTIDKVTSFDSSGTAPTSADLLAAIDTEVNQVSQTTDLPYTDSQYLSYISDVNFAKGIKSVDKQITQQEKLAKEQAEQKARKEWAKQHPVEALLQNVNDETTKLFKWANQEVQDFNLNVPGVNYVKDQISLRLGFISKACETIGDLALDATQLGHLTAESIQWGANTLSGHKTPQWIKDDVTSAGMTILTTDIFIKQLQHGDIDAWKSVYKGIENSASQIFHNITSGNTFEIGGYLFDVATLVGPAAVGKLKYVDEASNLSKLAKTSEVASTVGKVEDGVKVGKEINRELKIINTNKFTKSGKEIVKVPKDISPSIQAKSWQGTGMYPGVDDYVDIKLVKGDKVYILESDYEVANNTHSGYATTFEAVKKSSYDSQKLSKSLQIMPYYDTEAEELSDYAEYRIKVTEYTVSNDLVAAYGEKTIANPQFGSGGAPQYFIKDIENKISLGQLKRGKSMPLHNHKISVDEYNAMIDSIY